MTIIPITDHVKEFYDYDKAENKLIINAQVQVSKNSDIISFDELEGGKIRLRTYVNRTRVGLVGSPNVKVKYSIDRYRLPDDFKFDEEHVDRLTMLSNKDYYKYNDKPYQYLTNPDEKIVRKFSMYSMLYDREPELDEDDPLIVYNLSVMPNGKYRVYTSTWTNYTDLIIDDISDMKLICESAIHEIILNPEDIEYTKFSHVNTGMTYIFIHRLYKTVKSTLHVWHSLFDCYVMLSYNSIATINDESGNHSEYLPMLCCFNDIQYVPIQTFNLLHCRGRYIHTPHLDYSITTNGCAVFDQPSAMFQYDGIPLNNEDRLAAFNIPYVMLSHISFSIPCNTALYSSDFYEYDARSHSMIVKPTTQLAKLSDIKSIERMADGKIKICADVQQIIHHNSVSDDQRDSVSDPVSDPVSDHECKVDGYSINRMVDMSDPERLTVVVRVEPNMYTLFNFKETFYQHVNHTLFGDDDVSYRVIHHTTRCEECDKLVELNLAKNSDGTYEIRDPLWNVLPEFANNDKTFDMRNGELWLKVDGRGEYKCEIVSIWKHHELILKPDEVDYYKTTIGDYDYIFIRKLFGQECKSLLIGNDEHKYGLFTESPLNMSLSRTGECNRYNLTLNAQWKVSYTKSSTNIIIHGNEDYDILQTPYITYHIYTNGRFSV